MLARLDVLVHLKEVLDFQSVEPAEIVDVPQVRGAGVGYQQGNDLVVATVLIDDSECPHCAKMHEDAGKQLVAELQHRSVQRIAVSA